MRSFFAIFSLLLLVSIQAVDACCDHDSGVHAHLEKVSDGMTDQMSEHIHHHDGPCGCVCHQKLPTDKSSFPTPRVEVEPLPKLEVCDWNSCPDHLSPPSTGPPLAEKLSLPPSSAAEICSQHCRFLLWSPPWLGDSCPFLDSGHSLHTQPLATFLRGSPIHFLTRRDI